MESTTIGAIGGALAALKIANSPLGIRLVEAVENAVGGLAAPWQIRRVAQANADARIISAQAEADARLITVDGETKEEDLLFLRAADRFRFVEQRRQENIESVVGGAIDQIQELVDDSTPAPGAIDTDWASRFFGNCQDVSNSQMQSLWSSLLAGEVKVPGTFSLRTLDLVRQLNNEDADLFTNLSSFLFTDKDAGQLVVAHVESIGVNRYLAENGIPFIKKQHLVDIGLLSSAISAVTLSQQGKPNWYLNYGESRYSFALLPKGALSQPSLEMRLLTAAGIELYPICGAKLSMDYPAIATESLAADGIAMQSITD